MSWVAHLPKDPKCLKVSSDPWRPKMSKEAQNISRDPWFPKRPEVFHSQGQKISPSPESKNVLKCTKCHMRSKMSMEFQNVLGGQNEGHTRLEKTKCLSLSIREISQSSENISIHKWNIQKVNNNCHTRLHLGFSAKLRIWQVPTCKKDPRSGIISCNNGPATDPPTQPPGKL